METIKAFFYYSDNKSGRFLMKKIISLLSCYFLTLIVSFAIGLFIFMQYYDSINLVAGMNFSNIYEKLILGLFRTLPVIYILLPFSLILYKIRHKDNPVISFITFAVLTALNWFVFFPLTLKIQVSVEKNLFEKNYSAQKNTLSKGYFRKANEKLYFFNKGTEENDANVILIEDFTNPLDFAKEEKIDISENSNFAKDSFPFKDPLVKETMLDIPYSVINIFNSIKIRALHSFSYGYVSWLCFCSLGFALASLYAFVKFSSWRLVNAVSVLLCSSALVWFNDFYFCTQNNSMRLSLEKLFYSGGKLNFFIENGIAFPLMIINLTIGFVFLICGIITAVIRKRDFN